MTGPAGTAAVRRTGVRGVVAPWLLGAAIVAGAVLVTALLAGGGAPRPSPAGLPDAGPVTGWGLPVVQLLADLVGFAAVGLVLVGSGLLASGPVIAAHARGLATRVAAVWAGLAVLRALLHVSEVQGVPLVTTDLAALGSLTTALGGSPEAIAILAQAALALSLVWLVGGAQGRLTWAVTLAVAAGAFFPPALVGHAATADARVLATASLALHVGAAAVWVGGLAALAWVALRDGAALVGVVPRYSALALWCVGLVAVSGVVNAVMHVGSLDQLLTRGYGVLVLAKTAALVLLAGFGWLHRRHTVTGLRARAGTAQPRWRAALTFLALASVELLVMAVTVALAVGLSQTPPP